MKRRCFGTDGIRGPVGGDLMNAEFVLKLGWALGSVLRERQGPGHVLIGKDTRVSGYMLESALESGLSASGMDIRLLGPMPTPAVAYLTGTLRASAGIMISASHNPYTDNGIKFFTAGGEKFSDELEAAIELRVMENMKTVPVDQLGKAERVSGGAERYIEYCKSKFDSGGNLQGLKIVVDCANGATYHIAPDVFRELGAQVTVIHSNPDGFNINAECGSTAPESLQAAVLEHQADVGLAFDGDGDRLCMVDAKGYILDGDTILYMIARHQKSTGRLKGGVVGTLMTNFGLEQAFAAQGIPFRRVAVGDRHVWSALCEEGWDLGGEQSGHIFSSAGGASADGIIAALVVLDAMHASKQPLEQLHAQLQKTPQFLENLPKPADLDVPTHPAIQAAVETARAQLGETGRIILRASGTQPLIRLMVEASDAQQAKNILGSLSTTIQGA